MPQLSQGYLLNQEILEGQISTYMEKNLHWEGGEILAQVTQKSHIPGTVQGQVGKPNAGATPSPSQTGEQQKQSICSKTKA